MLLNIQKFILLLFLSLLAILYAIFAIYFVDNREQTAAVILEGLQNDMSELSYVLSKNLSNSDSIPSMRALLDRAASNSDFIDAIMLLDDRNVLITTDPHYHIAPSKQTLYHAASSDAYDNLLHKKGFEGIVRYYEGAQVHNLQLVFLIDQEEISMHFRENRLQYLFFFGLLPVTILAFIWLSIQYFITKPLERLRQYAYYQSEVPHAFRLRELESIRSSMLQTFTRLEQEQQQLYKMARTDSLSGLDNRNSLNEYLQRLIADSSRSKKEFALLFLDLDRFKMVNDSLGHQIGDELLQNVASAIHEVLRSNDFVARVGGDEFVIILHYYRSMTEITRIIERIQERLNVQWCIQTHPITITGSIGIAFYPKDGVDIISLMKHADIAMYEAKKKGRAQYHFFTEALNISVQETIELDKAMRHALENNEYVLYYQPKTDIETGKIIGAEALIRWISPKKGMIAPDEFIPLAEENGFIIELGEWVFRHAVYQLKLWQDNGIHIPVSINVATQQLLDTHFETKLTTALKEHNVDPAMIDIEITEYLFFEHNNNNLKTLDIIHSNGISISLDDFGTGYSSLSYLKKFPIDNLKIDRSFIEDYDTPEGAVFLETIVKMGETLNIKTIAEGVETKEQLAFLKSIGCDIYQGYYCSKPLSAEDFGTFYVASCRSEPENNTASAVLTR